MLQLQVNHLSIFRCFICSHYIEFQVLMCYLNCPRKYILHVSCEWTNLILDAYRFMGEDPTQQAGICIKKRYDISDIMRVKGGEYKQPAVCLPFSLGVCYDNGKGVQQDKAEAVQRYRKDAEQADADAQFNLGVCSSRTSRA